MSSHTTSHPFSELLSANGLMRKGALAHRALGGIGSGEDGAAAASTQDSRDESTLRQVFSARYPAIDLFDREAREKELTRRGSVLQLLVELYRSNREALPEELHPDLQPEDVEAVFSTLQRLALSYRLDAAFLLTRFSEPGAGEAEVLGRALDPLQLRSLLCAHRRETGEFLRSHSVGTLTGAVERGERPEIRRWFDRLTARLDLLPRDLPQALRSFFAEMWPGTGGDFAGLAQEIAALDLALFDEVGWENSRTFFACLRRAAAPGSEALDVFLTDAEVDSALVTAEALRHSELAAHFRRLACTMDLQQIRQGKTLISARAEGWKKRSLAAQASQASGTSSIRYVRTPTPMFHWLPSRA